MLKWDCRLMRSTHRCGEQRTKGICSHHNPIFEFDRKDRRASDNGLPARGLRAGDTEDGLTGRPQLVGKWSMMLRANTVRREQF